MSMWLSVGGDDTWMYCGWDGWMGPGGMPTPKGWATAAGGVGGDGATVTVMAGGAGGVGGGTTGATRGSQGSTHVATLTSTSRQ